MQRIPRALLAIVSLVAVVALVAGVGLLRTPPGVTPRPAPAVVSADEDAAGEPGDKDAGAGEADADENENEEAAEQAEGIARRREALDRAVAAGTPIGQQRPAGDAPAQGWAGEQPFEATAPDDWEPAVAAGPPSPWGYVLLTRYGVTKPCGGKCPTPYIPPPPGNR